ncbi:MAG: uroporphyrinogen-III C-methyltransferase [Planctomycetes bacterium]|nr:uroporphyrinogen-III C-methyltransferase [Planctomycetota bacterium]MBI3833854.1 uroporphyrinogen-III C-methyltransferase [Planctomycetota bacterium]
MNSPSGIVYLVGAGPGDPGLITVRGRELLRAADVIVHDRLVSRELVALSRRDAEIIDVGKSPGNPQDSQERIHQILCDRAKTGKMVVRLKGGDPFVFGRGFEELQSCRQAGVPCIVIPGVSSAIAAPEIVGIPLTGRGISHSLAIITAEGAGGVPPEYNYEALAAIDTLVILMGRAGLPRIVDSLRQAGRSPSTPAACIERATTPMQRVTVSTLGELVAAVERDGLKAPMVTVIGDAAAYPRTDEIGEMLPLLGKRIVVTRPRSTAQELLHALTARGAEVITCPLIKIQYQPNSQVRSTANASTLPLSAKALETYDWIVFTSQHAVRGLFQQSPIDGLDARAVGSPKIAAIGAATSRALGRFHFGPDLIPRTQTAMGLADAIRRIGENIEGMRILFPCGDQARTELVDELRRCGATVDARIVYSTVASVPSQDARRLIEEGVDAIIFCSPSAVRQFVATGLRAGSVLIACLGRTTAAEAVSCGMRADVVPQSPDVHELVTALESAFSMNPSGVAK